MSTVGSIPIVPLGLIGVGTQSLSGAFPTMQRRIPDGLQTIRGRRCETGQTKEPDHVSSRTRRTLAGGTRRLQHPPSASPEPVDPGQVTDDPTIVVSDMSFTSDRLTVEAGTTVTWVFQDDMPHNVVGDGFASEIMQSGTFTTRSPIPAPTHTSARSTRI